MEIFFSDNFFPGGLLLGAEESAHCVKVLRHVSGDTIYVIDGLGTMYECVLVDASPKGASARIVLENKNWGSHPYNLTLAVCPTKNNDRYEWFAEKAAEIGVDSIFPVIGDRSERKVFKTERLRKILLSATKQSLKARIPAVSEPMTVKEYIASAPKTALRLIAYCFDGEKQSIKSAIESYSGTDICVLIGPEGDFSPAEVEMAISAGFKPVHLGDSRLRTETAAVTAASAAYFNFMK